ncbi:precorrin-8X methylmutase, partial [Pseudomonas aeruginosa]|uniref:precorrin-8X methylmutase n=1 Tax=Pseudomonas aeruginosa TaxID=287 RepID=UPI0021AE0A60
MIDYIRDGQAIYRQSFATIRAEANLAGIPADLEKLAVRVIHACGMVDVVDDLRFSPGAGAAGRGARGGGGGGGGGAGGGGRGGGGGGGGRRARGGGGGGGGGG